MADKKPKASSSDERTVVDSVSFTDSTDRKIEINAYSGKGTDAIEDSHVDVEIHADGNAVWPRDIGAPQFDIYFSEGPIARAMAIPVFNQLRAACRT